MEIFGHVSPNERNQLSGNDTAAPVAAEPVPEGEGEVDLFGENTLPEPAAAPEEKGTLFGELAARMAEEAVERDNKESSSSHS